MQLQEGMMIYTHDGEKAGDIERFVLDPGAQTISHVVVSKGLIFDKELVIPVDHFHMEGDELRLKAKIDDPSAYPEFDDTVFITPDNQEVLERFQYQYELPLYYYPYPLGADNYFPPRPDLDSQEPVKVEVRNIPSGRVPVEKGADVVSSDGVKVGDIEEIFVDPNSNETSHFTVAQGFIFKDKKLIPAYWVEQVTEDSVHLGVSEKTLEKLADM
jgi:uncharacterized protein YrrD